MPPHSRITRDRLTWGSLKPKAEPKTMARRANHPRASLAFLGKRWKGSEMRGPQTAAMGLLTTEFGMNRKAMILGNENVTVNSRTNDDGFTRPSAKTF